MIDTDGDPPDAVLARGGRGFPLTVDGRPFTMDENDPSGRDLRGVAGLTPASAHTLIHVLDRGGASVGLDEKVRLRRDETAVFRSFRSDRLYTFTLDERGWEWGADAIREDELRLYGEVPDDQDIVLDKERDDVIDRGATIRLTGEGSEKFVTRPAPPRDVTIRVNGRERTVAPGLISYETVVRLAFPDAEASPDIIYTVSFRNGPPARPEGSLVAGQSVEVRGGMVFNATPTNRS